MQLVGPYMTTTNYKKRKKKKLTSNQISKLEQDWRAYNKRMRQTGSYKAQFDTLEEYIAYTRGEYVSKKEPKESKSFVPDYSYRGSENRIPSKGTGVGNAAKKETPKYTGDLIVGIGTMHKSNAVPIMRGTKQAEELAKMRR